MSQLKLFFVYWMYRLLTRENITLTLTRGEEEYLYCVDVVCIYERGKVEMLKCGYDALNHFYHDNKMLNEKIYIFEATRQKNLLFIIYHADLESIKSFLEVLNKYKTYLVLILTKEENHKDYFIKLKEFAEIKEYRFNILFLNDSNKKRFIDSIGIGKDIEYDEIDVYLDEFCEDEYSDMEENERGVIHSNKISKTKYDFGGNCYNEKMIIIITNGLEEYFLISIFILIFTGTITTVIQAIKKYRRTYKTAATLTIADLHKIPITIYGEIQDENIISCSICLNEYKKDDILRFLPCFHYFHKHCIDPWFLDSSILCPYCKKSVK